MRAHELGKGEFWGGKTEEEEEDGVGGNGTGFWRCLLVVWVRESSPPAEMKRREEKRKN